MSHNKEDLERLCIQLAPAIDVHLNPEHEPGDIRKVGFLLVAFEFGAPGSALAYVANANPDGVTSALRELIARIDTTSKIVSVNGATHLSAIEGK